MTGITSLPRDIQKLADQKGWEEDNLLGLIAAFVAQNNLEDELLEFLQDEGERLDGSSADKDDGDDEDDLDD